MGDIFEDVKIMLGCNDILDIQLHKTEIQRMLHKINFNKYPAKNVKDFMCYVFPHNPSLTFLR